RKSPEELENIISHELVHAYIFSALGADDTLPKWFTEGVALYLSNTKDQYISSNGIWGDFISRASDEYEEYRQVFRYLEHSLGRRGVARFIRRTVEQQSVTDSLPQIAGVSDYVVLRNKAQQWQTLRQNLFAGIGLGLIMIIVITGSWYGYRRRLWQKNRLQKQTQTLGKMIQSWDRKITAQTRKMFEIEAEEERKKIVSRITRMKQKKALALVSLGRALVKLGDPMEAEHRYAEAREAAGASLRVIEIIQQAQDELKGWIV
ncbi:MAG TPA: basic secretory protein-like protein, partial [Bacillota bacterium]|nr:basic secretory protein-like protein [Bacillota bacterium]